MDEGLTLSDGRFGMTIFGKPISVQSTEPEERDCGACVIRFALSYDLVTGDGEMDTFDKLFEWHQIRESLTLKGAAVGDPVGECSLRECFDDPANKEFYLSIYIPVISAQHARHWFSD